MELFYRALQAGKAPADAVQAASIEFRQIAPHPFYWAGFVLLGDPQHF
jgi:CHAT domain-containing protein